MNNNRETPVDLVRKALVHAGINLSHGNEDNLTKTPTRWLEMLSEFNQQIDIDELFRAKTQVPDRYHSMLVQSHIPYRALCAHHLVPVLGKAHIGYVPRQYFLGLSKFTRLVHAVACQRPSLQELVCDEVADLIMQHLHCSGTIVVIQAEHGCMACRGVKEAGVITSTAAVRGVFRDVPQARSEFYQLIASRRDL